MKHLYCECCIAAVHDDNYDTLEQCRVRAEVSEQHLAVWGKGNRAFVVIEHVNRIVGPEWVIEERSARYVIARHIPKEERNGKVS